MRKQLTIICLSAIGIIGITSNSSAETKTSNQDGNWSTDGIWTPSGVPAAGDDVIIDDAHDVTVDVNSTCLSLRLNTPTSFNGTTLIVPTGITLTVNGDVNIDYSGSASGGTVLVLQGTATVTMTGNLNFNASSVNKSIFDMGSGASVLNIGGNMVLGTEGTLASASGGSIVNFNGSGAQTLTMGANFIFEEITLNNSGSGITLGAAITDANVTGNISIQTGIFDNGGFAIAEASGDLFSISSGATFRLSGTSTWPSGFCLR